MPPIRNARELKQQARSRNFLNSSSPQYQTVNRFTQKLMDLQDKLKSDSEKALKAQVAKYSRDLMNLQMHNTPMVSPNALNTSIIDVTVDLPYYLKTPGKGKDTRTGYQQLVEAGEKYGAFTKAELDEAMTLVGQGMGVEMGVDDPEKEKQKEAQLAEEEAQRVQLEAEQQAIIDAQANIALLENEEEQRENEKEKAGEVRKDFGPPTEKWLQLHQETIQKDEGKYKAQGMPKLPYPPDSPSNATYLDSSTEIAGLYLKEFGILRNGETEEYPPERPGAPAVFVVKNGKISSLREAGLGIYKKEGNDVKPNPEFAMAMLRGEVFAYLPGERYPVQLQGTVRKDDYSRMEVRHSAPLNPGAVKKLELPPEPQVSREPRWYHRAFKFWGDNRRICEEYAATSAKREKWRRETEKLIAEQSKALPEADRMARDIEAKYGAQRTEAAMQSELRATYQNYCADRQKRKIMRLEEITAKSTEVEFGVSIVDNVYAAKPKIKEEWVSETDRISESNKFYTRKKFATLSQADIDPTSVKIGDKTLTEHDFATIAMFGSVDPKLGVQAQKKSVGDPTAMLQGLQKDGYSQAEAEQIVSNSIRNAYTVDIIHKEDRMWSYFETAVNGGRKRAEEALKGYPQDKTKLAGILADGVGYAAEMAGTTNCLRAPGDAGIDGLVKLAGEMLDLAERDPELKKLVKDQLEAKDKAFCEAINKQVAPFAKDGKGLLKPKSFEEAEKEVRQYQKFMDLNQKAMDATKALQQADAEGKTLAEDVKRGYIKDVLKGNMATAIYQKQHAERIEGAKSTGANDGVLALNAYINDMTMRILGADDEDAGNAVSRGGGSSLPSRAPAILISGTQNRFTEKPPVLQLVSNPKQMAELDKQAEQIMEQDGLDKLDMDELNEKFYNDAQNPSPYWGNDMILRTAKLAEPRMAGPAQPQLNKQQQLGGEQPQQEENRIEEPDQPIL